MTYLDRGPDPDHLTQVLFTIVLEFYIHTSYNGANEFNNIYLLYL